MSDELKCRGKTRLAKGNTTEPLVNDVIRRPDTQGPHGRDSVVVYELVWTLAATFLTLDEDDEIMRCHAALRRRGVGIDPDHTVQDGVRV